LEKDAVIAMVAIPFKYKPLGWMFSRGLHDRLEARLERAMNSSE
jgi:hypothetical protein